MIVLRKFIVFLMFSTFLVGCTTPLIDIDVKHTSGGGPGSGGGSCHPILLAMHLCIPSGGASLPILGTVGAEAVPGFTVQTANGELLLPTPPFVVNPVNGVPTAGSEVMVTISNLEIRKKDP